jgi:hypothetical protein
MENNYDPDVPRILLNTKEVRYGIIKRVAKYHFNWKLKKCDIISDEFDIFWTDI